MAAKYNRPASAKRIASIEQSIFETAETYLRLKAELDAVRTGVEIKDYLNPKYAAAYKAVRDFVVGNETLFYITIVD